MRPLSAIEKSFINRVLELDEKEDLIYIHNVLSGCLDKQYEIEFYGYEINAQREIGYIVKLHFKEGQYIRLNGIIGDLISISYFIDNLLEQGYLVKEKITDVTGSRFINKFSESGNVGEYQIQSETVKTKFAEKLQYKFYATELLRELKANNYDTFEKKEAKLTRKIALWGLFIAILSAIASTTIPLFKQDSMEIDKKSIEYFIKLEKQQLNDSVGLKNKQKKNKLLPPKTAHTQ